MKLTIVAATGGIGRQLLQQALAAGHDVTAVVRNPAKLAVEVAAVTADLASPDPAALEPALAGADAVLSGLGPVARSNPPVAGPGTQAMITAMAAAGVRRIVVVSAAPVGTVPVPGHPTPKHDPGDGIVMRTVLSPMIKTFLRATYADLAVMEDALRHSGLDWTVVRPPRLTDGPLTASYRTEYGQNIRGGFRISRADVAHLMLQSLDRPDTVGQVIGIAN
jgi:putative NADH-flavin reductase